MNEEYYGMGKTAEHYCGLAISKVPEQHRDDEAGLRSTRWFDYQHLSPAEATYLFAAQYAAAYREAYARTRDHIKAASVSPFLNEDIFQTPELSAVWLARRAADSIGCKYSFYLRFIFLRFEHRGWKYLPRPNQIYSEELVLDIRDAWDIECIASLQIAKHSLFNASDETSPEHAAYYEWLIGQIKKREHQHFAISSLVYVRGILPERVASDNFSNDIMARAKAQYRNP